MLKRAKQLGLHTLKSVGAFGLALDSRWRRNRLLILAYHGISQDDEHLWNPSLYMSPETLRGRMELLDASGCTVLPLGEAVARLYAGDLPPRSVAITFDDGAYDFSTEAWPIAREFGFPVTLYLTTYYSYFNRPVFDVICSYLLWKGRWSTVDAADFTGRAGVLDLGTEESRIATATEIRTYVLAEGMSAREKDDLAAKLAGRLGVDYDAILERRLLHLLNPEEVARLASEGVDVQLHSHRHRAPLDRDLFVSEVEENRSGIEPLTNTRTEHFCYPSGVTDTRFLPWLEEAGVRSATTCDPGFAGRDAHPLLLPRLVDTMALSPIEFEGWLTGVSTFLPRRPVRRRLEVLDR